MGVLRAQASVSERTPLVAPRMSIPSPRLKSRWFRQDAPRDPAQLASAAAAIVWRTADHRLRHMRSVGFAIDAGAPYVQALVEVLAFLIALADRIAYEHDAGPWRSAFTSALTIRVSELFRACFAEVLGADAVADYGTRFIERCNARMSEYSVHHYTPSGPDFGFLRYFGDTLAAVLPDELDRRWGADQAMSVEGPAAAE